MGVWLYFFFFQAEDGIRDFCLSRGLGDVYKRQINNGMVLMHIPTFYQKIAVGLIILIAVSIDVVQQTMKERRMVKVDIKD